MCQSASSSLQQGQRREGPCSPTLQSCWQGRSGKHPAEHQTTIRTEISNSSSVKGATSHMTVLSRTGSYSGLAGQRRSARCCSMANSAGMLCWVCPAVQNPGAVFAGKQPMWSAVHGCCAAFRCITDAHCCWGHTNMPTALTEDVGSQAASCACNIKQDNHTLDIYRRIDRRRCSLLYMSVTRILPNISAAVATLSDCC